MRVISTQGLERFNPPAFYTEHGYTNIRIPGVAALDSGRLLCWYECRRGGDWSAIDIGMQTSDDGGKTWGRTRIIADGKGRCACNNPVMIPDGDTLYFLYCENYKRLFLRKSTDGGLHFSDPVEWTAQIDRLMNGRFWSVLAVGPGHGIAMPGHTLFVPMWFGSSKTDMFAHHPSYIAVLRITEGGRSADLSHTIGEAVLTDPSECCIAALPDGRILLNIRHESPVRCRAVSFGNPADNTWSVPRFEDALPDPICMAGMCRCGDGLLFTNCASKDVRSDLTLRKLTADCRIAESLLVSSEGGYSDVCYAHAHSAACIVYENGTGHLQTAIVSV